MQITTDPGYNDYARGGHTLTTPSKFSSASHRSLAAHKQKLLVISTLSNHKNEGENKITEISENKMTFQEHINYLLLKGERTDEEAKHLLKVIKTNAFFESFLEINDNLEAQSLLAICKNIKYEKFPKGSVICQQGDKSNEKMYIVYSGELNVHIKDPDVFIHQNLQQKREERRKAALEELQESEEVAEPPELKEKMPAAPKSAMLKRGPGLFVSNDPEGEKLSPFLKRAQNSPKGHRNTVIATEAKPSPFALQAKKEKGPEPPKLVLNPKISKGLKKLSLISKVVQGFEKSRKESFDNPHDHVEYGLVVDTIHKGGFFGERALLTNQPRGATIVAIADCELLVITKDLFMSLKDRFDKKKNAILGFILNSIPTLDQLASRSIFDKLYYLFKEHKYEYGTNIITEDTKGDYIYLLYDGECEIVKDIKIDKTMTLKYQMAQISPLIGLNRMTCQKVLIYTIPKGTFFGDEAMFQKNHKYQYTVRVSSPRATVFSIHRGKFFMRFPSSAYVALKQLFQKKLESHEKRLSQVISTKFKGYNEETLDDSVDQQANASRERLLSAKPGKIIINKENTKEPSKVTVIAKEPSPYYNVFRHERPFQRKFTDSSLVQADSMNDSNELEIFTPGPNMNRKGSNQTAQSQIYDPRGLKRVDYNLNRLLKMPGESLSRDLTCDIFRPGSARIKTEGEFADSREIIDTPQQVLTSRKTMEYGSKTLKPNPVAWNEALETQRSHANRTSIKLEGGGPPSGRRGSGDVEIEPKANNPSNFRLDIATADSELHRKNKLKRLEIRMKGVQTVRVVKNSTDRVSLIKASIMTKKNKFDRKNAKLEKNFKNLIQTTGKNSEELSPYDLPFLSNRVQTLGDESPTATEGDDLYLKRDHARKSPVLKNPSFLNMQLVNKEVTRRTPMSASRNRIQTISPWGVGGIHGIKDKGLEFFLSGESQPSLTEIKNSARELIIFTDRSIETKAKTKTLRSVSSYSSSARFRPHKMGLFAGNGNRNLNGK